MTVRFGYSYWGFLGDNKIEGGREVSTPDGNATYSWSIIHEAQKRGWAVYNMQKDRDWEAWSQHRSLNFKAFSENLRVDAYMNLHSTEGMDFPELDVLLLEWRFPIPGRNVGLSETDPNFQPDLKRQWALIDYYTKKNTKIIIWDMDHKLTEDEENNLLDIYLNPVTIFETSVSPREQVFNRVRVEPPIVISELRQHEMLNANFNQKLSYVGSRYERDDVIEQYIKPVSDRFPQQVHFYGNWTREPNLTECKAMWPNVEYHGRITTRGFRDAYARSVACPLLAKRSYIETGFITPRVWEALMFGTIPVGLKEMLGINNYLPEKLLAKDAAELAELVGTLPRDAVRRAELREEIIERISFMDVRHFVDKIEDVLNDIQGTA